MTAATPQPTDFSLDVIGRYVCNGLDEANSSGSFDVIVIGGGSFGAALAQHVFFNDSKDRKHRVLVLEAGPMVLTEHVQNLPMIGLNVPGPIAQDPYRLRQEVWGLPWRADFPYTGLAYMVGGRSVFFGGWSPRLLDTATDTEMDRARWPAAVVDDLNGTYFAQAAEQIGTDRANDFIHGPLHEALARQLLGGIATVRGAIPPAELPDHLVGRTPASHDIDTLEAPLAVQSQTREGAFPINKFSSVPLLIKAARVAWAESGGNDSKKRLIVVPRCQVTGLAYGMGRVTGIRTTQGDVVVPSQGVVVIALGTIESARLALRTFRDVPNYERIGQNLMAHLRSNLTIQIPRQALQQLPNAVTDLSASALFVKGRHDAGATRAHFHLQITAAGLGSAGTDSEAELFKKWPDLDTFNVVRHANDDHVVITIRGIGEMQPDNPANHVELRPDDPSNIEFVDIAGQRAKVFLQPGPIDIALWDAMDVAADDVALVFAGGLGYKVLMPDGTLANVGAGQPASGVLAFNQRRDGLGTTHHEAGPLRMGDDPTRSVTNAQAHVHHVANAYAIGPVLLPTVGSPNPMLSGIALARRLGDHLTQPGRYVAETGWTAMFDAVGAGNWRMAGSGQFIQVDDVLEAVPDPNGELGLYWCTDPTPPDFALRLEWLRTRDDDNSGVFLRFPDPNSKGYVNTAWVGVNFGFEVQIDENAAPDGADRHRTGAIYGELPQAFSLAPARPIGTWNECEIRVKGQTYVVRLNGSQVTSFAFAGNPAVPDRGLPGTAASPRFIGLQAHTGRVLFRRIRIKAI
jgi:choline dehydrogenase-like flavoprotein